MARPTTATRKAVRDSSGSDPKGRQDELSLRDAHDLALRILSLRNDAELRSRAAELLAEIRPIRQPDLDALRAVAEPSRELTLLVTPTAHEGALKLCEQASQGILAVSRNDLRCQLEREIARAGERLGQPTTSEGGLLGGSKAEPLEWLARAMLLVKDHPDWKDKQIADSVGKHPSTLSRSPEYKFAAARFRGARTDRTAGWHTHDLNGLHGVEAVAPETQPDDQSDRGEPIPGSNLFREYCAQCQEPLRVPRSQVGKAPVCDNCRD